MAAVTEQVALLINAASKIVWPVAITVLLLKYRHAVIDLLGNTKKVSAAGLEIEFQDQTQDVLADLDEAQLHPPSSENTLLTDLARSNPRLAINVSWTRVRDASTRAAASIGVTSRSTVRRIERLRSRGYANDEIVSLAQTLKSAQSTLAGQPEVEPPQDFAEAFALGALSLAQWLDRAVPSTDQSGFSSGDALPSGYPTSGDPTFGYPTSGDPTFGPTSGDPASGDPTGNE